MVKKSNIRSADILVRSKSMLGFVDHYGLYVGQRRVIENHPQHGVRIVSLERFLNGRDLLEVKHFNGGDQGRRMVVAKAYRLIGTRYDLINFNCEHFVNLVRRQGMKSHQVDAARNLALGLIAIGIFAHISRN